METTRKVALIGAILSFLALQPFMINVLPTLPSVHARSRTITLVGIEAAWNYTSTLPNPTIAVLQSDAITMPLSSGDGNPHRFFVDVDNSGTTPNCAVDKCSSLFPPSTTFSFTVDFAIGTYKYYCSVHPTTMVGSFIVVDVVGGTFLQPDKLMLLAPLIGIASIIVGSAFLAMILAKRQGRRAETQ